MFLFLLFVLSDFDICQMIVLVWLLWRWWLRWPSGALHFEWKVVWAHRSMYFSWQSALDEAMRWVKNSPEVEETSIWGIPFVSNLLRREIAPYITIKYLDKQWFHCSFILDTWEFFYPRWRHWLLSVEFIIFMNRYSLKSFFLSTETRPEWQ